MTTELEKLFFNTFGIEPIRYKRNVDDNAMFMDKVYPPITDRILLELICVHYTYLETNLYSLDYESLKKEILKDLIDEQESRELKKDYVSDDMKQQVQELFRSNDDR